MSSKPRPLSRSNTERVVVGAAARGGISRTHSRGAHPISRQKSRLEVQSNPVQGNDDGDSQRTGKSKLAPKKGAAPPAPGPVLVSEYVQVNPDDVKPKKVKKHKVVEEEVEQKESPPSQVDTDDEPTPQRLQPSPRKTKVDSNPAGPPISAPVADHNDKEQEQGEEDEEEEEVPQQSSSKQRPDPSARQMPLPSPKPKTPTGKISLRHVPAPVQQENSSDEEDVPDNSHLEQKEVRKPPLPAITRAVSAISRDHSRDAVSHSGDEEEDDEDSVDPDADDLPPDLTPSQSSSHSSGNKGSRGSLRKLQSEQVVQKAPPSKQKSERHVGKQSMLSRDDFKPAPKQAMKPLGKAMSTRMIPSVVKRDPYEAKLELHHYDDSEESDQFNPETLSETDDWIFGKLVQHGWKSTQIGHFAVASEADCAHWVQYASKVRTEFLHLFVFHTFRKKVRNPFISDINQLTLRWLTDMYAGNSPTDPQINVLPFAIKNPFEKNLHLLYWHLEILTKTIGECAALISAGYVNLLSRSESEKYVTERGQYLLRVSNLKPNQLVLTCWSPQKKLRNIYLEGKMVPAKYNVDRTVTNINGVDYVLYHWKNDSLLRWLSDHSQEFMLEDCVLGQISLHEMLHDSNYEVAVGSAYDNVKSMDNMYSHFAEPPRNSRSSAAQARRRSTEEQPFSPPQAYLREDHSAAPRTQAASRTQAKSAAPPPPANQDGQSESDDDDGPD
eukprot:TRINITY_DN8002_c0_g2_i1.p1 TRINITY_DN8002_c0_g2~~TRINITY_DN8002_c0_g2_i1.p1  ORF type:complete len:724 (-),score=169.00 TRINITY_DN8002_c0_g2_i1:35-2206(-)